MNKLGLFAAVILAELNGNHFSAVSVFLTWN